MAAKYFAVMLVDDNEIDNIVSSKIVEGSGLAEVTYTHSTGISAIDFIKNIRKISTEKDNKLPKFIFLDIDMPMMDGFQFLEEFEKMDDFTKNYTKIIMVTASMNPKDKELASSYSSFYRYISKPLSPKSLTDL